MSKMRVGMSTVASVAVVAAIMLLPAGGAAARATTSVTAGLSTADGVVHYLTSIGIDPKGVVVQRGARNYAGPTCPGAKWNCTTSRRVFQVSTSGGANLVACVAPGGTATGGGSGTANVSCVIVQASSSSSNVATCTEHSLLAAPASLTQTCDITQTSGSGANQATVTQLSQEGPLCDVLPSTTTSQQTQYVSQVASVVQSGPAGAATATINQDATQCAATFTSGTATQSQTTRQEFTVRQGPVGFDPTSPAGCGSKTGALAATATQSQHQIGVASHAGTGSAQTQRADLIGHLDQCSGDVARWIATQSEDQFLGQNTNVQQSQFGPTRLTGKPAPRRGRTLQRGYCCSFQGVNPLSTCVITQTTKQTGNPNALQVEDLTTRAGSSGTCKGDISSTQNSATNGISATTTPGGLLDQTQVCTSGSCTVPTALAWSGDTAGTYHEPATLGATLTRTDAVGGGVPSQTVSLGVGAETCSPAPVTNGSGVATCQVRINDKPGSYAGSASFAGNAPFLGSAATLPSFTVAKHPTTLIYTGPASAAYHDAVTLSARLLEKSAGPAVDARKPVTFTLGTQSCSGTTNAGGTASCAITIKQAPGSVTFLTISFAGDAWYLPATDLKPAFSITQHPR